MKSIMNVSVYLCIVLLFCTSAFGGKGQKLETPYWQFSYRGNGEIRIQQDAEFYASPRLDASSNIVGWTLETEQSTNMIAYGVTDNLPFVLWILNSDEKSSLTIKSNTRERSVSAQHFCIVGSNSNLRRLKISVARNATFGTRVPLGGPTWNPVLNNDYLPFIFIDGTLGQLSLNCDLWGTVVYARSIGTLTCKDMYFSSIIVGLPDREIPELVAGSVTNKHVLVFKDGEIGKLKAGRMVNVPVLVGSGMVKGFMDEASTIYSDPAISPDGPIGLLKADELCGLGDYEDGRWMMSSEPLRTMNTLIISSKIERYRVKRIRTQGTSVYVHGQ